jgi:hypothetical protein
MMDVVTFALNSKGSAMIHTLDTDFRRVAVFAAFH